MVVADGRARTASIWLASEVNDWKVIHWRSAALIRSGLPPPQPEPAAAAAARLNIDGKDALKALRAGHRPLVLDLGLHL